MKQNQKGTSIQQQTFEELVRRDCQSKEPYQPVMVAYDNADEFAISPNPPTPEAIKRAQFVDKTYVWTGK